MYQALIPAAVGAGANLAGGIVKMVGQDSAMDQLRKAKQAQEAAAIQEGNRSAQRLLSTSLAGGPQRNPLAAAHGAALAARDVQGDISARTAGVRAGYDRQLADMERQKGDLGGQLFGALGSSLATGASSLLGSGMGQPQAQPTSFDPNALIQQKNAAMPQYTAADKSVQAGQQALQGAGGMPMMGLLGQMGQVPAQMPVQQQPMGPQAMGYGQQPIVGPSDQPIVGPSDNPFLQMFPFRMG